MPEIPLNGEIVVNAAKIEVTDANNKPLKPGKYLFRLTVEDDLGAASLPAEITITVAGQPKVNIRLADGQLPIPPDKTFVLEAVVENPNGVPVKVFRWTRVR